MIEPVVEALQHRVVISLCAVDGEILFDAGDAAERHVLCDLDCIRAPGRDHLAARADEIAFEGRGFDESGIAIEPGEFMDFFLRELVVGLCGDDALRSTEKGDGHDGKVSSCLIWVQR